MALRFITREQLIELVREDSELQHAIMELVVEHLSVSNATPTGPCCTGVVAHKHELDEN
jgi:hypothetical protein